MLTWPGKTMIHPQFVGSKFETTPICASPDLQSSVKFGVVTLW